MTDINDRPRGGAHFLVMAAATIIVIGGIRFAGPLLIPFVFAAFLAILCLPAVDLLTRRRVPTVVAVLLVVLVLGGIMSGVGAIVGTSINQFTEAVPKYEQRVAQLWASVETWVENLPFEILPERPSNEQIVKPLEVIKPGQVMGFIGTGLKGVLAALQNTFLVILTLVFMLLEGTTFPTKIRLAFGGGSGSLDRFSVVTGQVQRYLAIKTVTSLSTGLLVGGWVGIVGLDFAVVWGLVAFLLNYIPNIGSIVAAVPAVLLAFVQLGLGPGIAVAVGYLVINVLIGNLIEPALLGRSLGLSTLVVFLSLVFWGWMWGTIGMLLSVPLTMMIKIFLENSEDLKWAAVLLDSGRALEARLKEEDGKTAKSEPPPVVRESAG
jgi:predicted PurR-regulated permease PerM